MSVDGVDSRASSSSASPVVDLVVIFGGWGNIDGGDPMPAGAATGASRLAGDVAALPKNLFRDRKQLVLEGAILNSGVNAALGFIRANFHPAGRLIIYGYSAGGTDALATCREIQSQMGFFSFATRQFFSVFGMEDRMSRESMGRVRVDLVVTVDAASGPLTGGLDRMVPVCVRSNVNFFQRTASRIGSRGGANVAVDPASTTVRNVDMTGPAVTHGTISDVTRSQALDAIQGALGREGDFPTPSGNRRTG